ncbi:probable low affinity copper uptake protein 2 [Chelonus insularis]|uniref:probable low affinity copper uptake protein 2 n=1 Tax=Chelonus insularis TaxID=460826 RepID=UPI0015893E14|nr:probable low affinity copper uptake protein 2 [Chelonus insularis]
MMHMWFWSGINLGTFLFPGYTISTLCGLIGACLSIIAIAIIYEAMKTLQIKLHQMTKASLSSDSFPTTENSSLLTYIIPKLPRFSNNSRCLGLIQWSLEVLHYAAHTTLGYFLMLAVMSYNIYIFLALIIGSTIGYWTFAPTLLNFNMNELHQRYKTIPSCNTECADTLVTERRQSTVSTVTEQLVSEVNAEVNTDRSNGS